MLSESLLDDCLSPDDEKSLCLADNKAWEEGVSRWYSRIKVGLDEEVLECRMVGSMVWENSYL